MIIWIHTNMQKVLQIKKNQIIKIMVHGPIYEIDRQSIDNV
jgi:hypothetical protein